MEKAHSRIKWENYPSIATPLNETNLNKMDIALDEVDNRVLGLDTAKLDKAVANTMVKDIAFNEKTGIFTITLLDGTTKTIDTKLEKVATNFSYDYETQKLVLTLVDGTKQEIDMSTLISQYEFADTSTIGFTVGNEGKITAIVKDGSITEDKLQPNFLANVKTEVSKAKSYADSSYENATTSRNAVTEAKQYRDEALQFRNEAESFAPEGYAELKEQVNENTVKVDTIIEKADLGIKETASGEEIHLTDSAEGKAVEFALYGKAKQNTTSGKNLLDMNAVTQTINGLTFTVNADKSVTVNGTATATAYLHLGKFADEGKYVLSGCPVGGGGGKYRVYIKFSDTVYVYDDGNGVTFENDNNERTVVLYIASGYTVNNLTFYPMISVDGGEYEPFTNGASPNPQYPQPIEVSGESGSVVVTSSNEYNTKKTTTTIPTPNGLAGIKVSSNGNYTDQNGQQWICDEVVKYADGSGEKIEWIKHYSFAVADMNNSESNAGWKNIDGLSDVVGVINRKLTNAMCNAGKTVNANTTDGRNIIYLPSAIYGLTQSEWKTNYPDLVVDIYLERVTPIHTPLTAEEIAEIEKLHTFYPITNISNDFDCGMKVKYNCDSKNYIDNKIALLTTAMVNNI